MQPLERRLLLSTGTVLASVYDDANGDGTRDGGEGGLSGVTLYVDVVGTGAYTSNDPSAQTAGSGSVTITGVPAGTYTVREVVPNGFTQTQPVEGGGQSVTVTAGGTMATPAAFGVEPDGSIGGAVYLDANGNGSEEPGETAPTTAVTVELRGEAGAGPVAATTTTRADGTFAFADVTPGTYAVLVVVPADYTVTQPAVGNAVVSVAPAGAVTGVTFGYAPLTPTPTSTATTGAITGTAYVDANGDGTDDAPRAGAVIYLDTNGSGVLDAGEPTATAGAQGTFTFADVTPGTYVVRQTVPLGDAPTQPGSGLYSVTVTAGGTATVAGFGVEPLPASGLTAVLAKQPPAAVVAGYKGTAPVRVTNSATATYTGPVSVSAYLSVDGTVVVGQSPLGTGAVKRVTLKPGKSTVVRVKYAVPMGQAGGPYSLVAAASIGSVAVAPAVAASAQPIAVAAATVSLSPTIVAPAAGVVVKPGKRTTVTVRVTNAGTVADVGTVTVAVFATLTGGSLLTTAVPVGMVSGKRVSVGAGKSTSVAVPITALSSAAAGTYDLFAVVTASTTPADLGTDDTSVSVKTR